MSPLHKYCSYRLCKGTGRSADGVVGSSASAGLCWALAGRCLSHSVSKSKGQKLVRAAATAISRNEGLGHSRPCELNYSYFELARGGRSEGASKKKGGGETVSVPACAHGFPVLSFLSFPTFWRVADRGS